jgi:Domain of unknown function (DUF4136)
MKPGFIFIFLFIICSSCFRNRLFIEHDYKYSLGFTDYKTYGFVDCQRDSNIICEDVQQAIKSQMGARGYKLGSGSPDLFVNFSVYYDRFIYKGYDQPNLAFWMNNGQSEDTYKPVKYNLNRGTIMISLIEAGTSEIVWRGYATGVFNAQSVKKNYYKNVVASIFSEYPLFATDEAFKRTKLNRSI